MRKQYETKKTHSGRTNLAKATQTPHIATIRRIHITKKNGNAGKRQPKRDFPANPNSKKEKNEQKNDPAQK